jgi:prepilin-type N-terminal cleavage/methylation domain-containing protein
MRSGFTLLETLIALVIAALITLVLMDTLSAATGHATRIEAATRAHTARTLALFPVLRALDAAAPDYHDGEHVFTGDASMARGLTLAGVAGVDASPSPFALEIASAEGAEDARLIYREHGEALIEVAVPAGAHLAYRDDDGETHEVWPPEDGFDPDPLYYRPIPSAILILDGERAVLAAAPARTTGLTLRVRDFDLVL